jgi:hypothetical protein
LRCANFPIQNGLKQGDALLPLLFSFALEYAIRKIHENLVDLKLNGTHQLLVCADNVNLLRDNMHTVKKKRETLIDASKEVGLEINAEKTECIRWVNKVMSLILYCKNWQTCGSETIKRLKLHPSSTFSPSLNLQS